ncbi:MAG: hypothetical protein HOP07_15015 [Bacteriovoracaceae bacterium]|nr:hypothetical protein [Bacteriovoracaceae bacterium]
MSLISFHKPFAHKGPAMSLFDLCTYLFSVFLGAFGTYWLAPHRHLGKIRSACALNLLFFFILSQIQFPENTPLRSLFLGASFVGMSDPKIVNHKSLFWISIVYLLLFFVVHQKVNFLGGSLGLMAFMATGLIYALTSKGMPKFIKDFLDK